MRGSSSLSQGFAVAPVRAPGRSELPSEVWGGETPPRSERGPQYGSLLPDPWVRPIGRHVLAPVAAPPEDRKALPGGDACCRPGQSRLPDPRLPGNGDELTPACARLVQKVGQETELRVTADEDVLLIALPSPIGVGPGLARTHGRLPSLHEHATGRVGGQSPRTPWLAVRSSGFRGGAGRSFQTVGTGVGRGTGRLCSTLQ
jgi:hypothetical protein